MALDTFSWPTQGMPEGTYDQRVRTAQFGDGYKQVAGDGINPETQTWPLMFNGKEQEMLPILTFFRTHTIKSFIWTPPYGEPGLYRVLPESIRASPYGGRVMTVSASFEQAYHP
jgi:phage-related protein